MYPIAHRTECRHNEKPQQHLNKCSLLLDVVSNLIHSFSVCSFVGRPIVRLNLGHRFFRRCRTIFELRESPPPLAMNPDSRSFCFIVDDQPTTLFEVTVASSYSVQGLKVAITELLGLDTFTSIILWKVRSCYNRLTPRELIRLIAEHASSSYP